MTTDGQSPTTEAELQAELTRLLARADQNGVDVRGGWECSNGVEQADWDIVVTEVEPEASQ